MVAVSACGRLFFSLFSLFFLEGSALDTALGRIENVPDEAERCPADARTICGFLRLDPFATLISFRPTKATLPDGSPYNYNVGIDQAGKRV